MLPLLQASTPALPINAVGGAVIAVSLFFTLVWAAYLYR
jgi:hypothetical protein